jgi:chemosensory pili system protein ChpE
MRTCTSEVGEPVNVLWLFVSAFGIGLALCIPPGAVTAEALRRGLAGGFWPVLLLEFGSLIGDATWAAIALVGVAVLVQDGPVRYVLGAFGVVFLLWLAWSALKDAWTGHVPKARTLPARRSFVTGAILSLTNPLAVAFWVGVGGGAVATIIPHPRPIDFAIFFAGYLTACVLWCFFFSALVAWGRQVLQPGFFRVVNLLCGTALAFFALRLLQGILQAT